MSSDLPGPAAPGTPRPCKLPRQRDSSKLEVGLGDCCFLGWFVADEILGEGGFPRHRADARRSMTSSTRG